MKTLNRQTVSAHSYPKRILQYGEGNFLRAFADWVIHKMNNKVDFDSGITVIQPIEQGLIHMLNDQDGLYTLYLNGIKNGKAISEHAVIDCIQEGIDPYKDHTTYLKNAENPDLRFIISNTTEAGISYDKEDTLEDAPQKSFPGKLTAFLYKRFLHFESASDKGLIIIPCELIDKNGENLKKIILKYAQEWNLDPNFTNWINEDTIFCNTLVDRIVPGYPRDKMNAITKELGYQDNLVVEGEQFHLWVIEGPDTVKEEFPADECGLNVVFTDNIEPYRTRKVRILNGGHTSLVPVGYLYGIDKVRESTEDEVVGKFLKETIFEEICPTLDLPKPELDQFANDVLDRFKNPYLEHALMSISLNSISKYKTRVLPSVLEYIRRRNALPKRLLFSLASLIVFYRGKRNEETIQLKDNPDVLAFFKELWAQAKEHDLDTITSAIHKVLSQKEFWGVDLTALEGFTELVSKYAHTIINDGMNPALIHFNQSKD
ncbi:tagaturonate reductase [Flagellimonas sp. HMM57]|uniref:tagaturonate reductase n=1 Tax=unclassified Flagellimonas TaxID=2644544 RepID=UPI0013D2ED8B|nr:MULTISPECIES: tagaturonate reductase [unclassified Flagellimonas]UII75373.1 tagaturonate reductase [Flagellimonas sp. HMM57]